MDLLSAGDWLDIRSALTDVKDTFLKFDITYKQRTNRTLNAFHEKREADLIVTEYTLKGLLIYKTTQEQGEVVQSAAGFADIEEGYILFDYQLMKSHSPSFINADGASVFIPNKDSMSAFGEELTIIAVNLVGPTETDYQLVRVSFKKNLPD